MQGRTAFEHERGDAGVREPSDGIRQTNGFVAGAWLVHLKLGTGRRQPRRAIGVPGHRRSSGYDYDRAGIQGREHPRRWRRAEPTVEDDPDERPHAIDATRGEQRIVGEDGAGPDAERVDLRAFPMDASVGRLSRQSASRRLARRQPSRRD